MQHVPSKHVPAKHVLAKLVAVTRVSAISLLKSLCVQSAGIPIRRYVEEVCQHVHTQWSDS